MNLFPFRSAWIAGCLPAVFLAGCAVGPDYHAPELPAQAPFRNQPLLEQRVSRLPAADMTTWWAGFGDKELETLVNRALAQNLDLAQAVARVNQARAMTTGARSALLPSGDLNAQASRNHQSLQDPIGQLASASPGFDRNSSLYQVDAGASWEVDIFGGLRRGLEAANAEQQTAVAQQAAVRLIVTSSAASGYIQLRTLQARLQVVESRVKTQTDLVRLLQLQYANGVVARLQLKQAEGVLATVSAQIPPLRSSIESTMNSLEVLSGVMPGALHQELAKVTPIPVAPGIDTAGGQADMLRRRPDVIAAERTLAASNARIGQAVADYYPKFSIGALLGSATHASGNLLSGDADQAQAVFGLRWRLFDFGRVKAEVEFAKGRDAQALAAYQQTLLQATADVENAMTQLVQSEKQNAVLEDGVRSLAEARAAAFSAFQQGSVSFIEVLDADDRLQQAQEQKLLAQSAASVAAVDCFKSLGGGWNAPRADVVAKAERRRGSPDDTVEN
ncbi:efflux transporter outer membrane subunit [Pseudomonas abietaniphila]